MVIVFLNIQGDFIIFVSQHYQEMPQHIYYAVVGSLGTIGVAISLLRNTVQRFQKFYTQFWRVILGLSAPLLLWILVAMIQMTLNDFAVWSHFEALVDWPILGSTLGYSPYPRTLICLYGTVALALAE